MKKAVLFQLCKLVNSGFTKVKFETHKKLFTKKERAALKNLFFIENEIYQIYKKTGKYKFKEFPFEAVSCGFLTEREVLLYSKFLIYYGWSPENHIKAVIEENKNVEVVGFWSSL